MSTAAHEPRRVGPRRADSHSGSKVAPRRNTPENSEPAGLQYDSDELPVLIRLPDLRDLGSVEKPQTSQTKKKRRSIERASAGKQKNSQQEGSEVSRKPIPLRVGHNKMLLGGIGGGILVVVTLVFFNAGSSEPATDQDGWASEAADLEALVQEPDITFATEIEPPPLYPGLTDQAPETQTAQFASGESESVPRGVPYYDAPRLTGQSDTAAVPQKPRSVDGWPSEEAMGLRSSSGSTPADHWPGENVSLGQGGYEYPPANSPSQTGYRSSMYPSETESFRMGKLNSDRPLATEDDQSSILDGNIEIPDTTSLRLR